MGAVASLLTNLIVLAWFLRNTKTLDRLYPPTLHRKYTFNQLSDLRLITYTTYVDLKETVGIRILQSLLSGCGEAQLTTPSPTFANFEAYIRTVPHN